MRKYIYLSIFTQGLLSCVIITSDAAALTTKTVV